MNIADIARDQDISATLAARAAISLIRKGLVEITKDGKLLTSVEAIADIEQQLATNDYD